MVVVCEDTGMTITYFTQSAKENENLPLIHDFVTWLALRYNLGVRIIRSDNEMNRIKQKSGAMISTFLLNRVLQIRMHRMVGQRDLDG